MIDIEGFEKQSKGLIQSLQDMQNSLTRNMQTMSQMDEAAPVMKKMDDLQVFMKNGDMKGVLKIQKELTEMKQEIERNGNTVNTDKQ